jgi:hypothetical protein
MVLWCTHAAQAADGSFFSLEPAERERYSPEVLRIQHTTYNMQQQRVPTVPRAAPTVPLPSRTYGTARVP